MKKLKNLLAVLLILSCVLIVHEAGHAWAMFKRGVPIETFSLGWNLGFIPSYQFHLSEFPGTTFKICPLLMGAYVKPTSAGEKIVNALSLYDQIAISGGGIRFNIIFCGMLLPLVWFMKEKDERDRLRAMYIGQALLAFSALFFGKIFCAWLVPLGSLAFIAFMISNRSSGGVAGPLGVFEFLFDNVGTFKKDVAMLCVFSFQLGIINALPIPPLDGGRIASNYIGAVSPHYATLFNGFGILLIYILFFQIFISDIRRLRKR